MTQFTANEVRTESCKQGQLHRQPASDMLNAFADLLETREKAVPVAWRADWPGWRQYHDEMDPLPESWDDNAPEILPLYTNPQPAQDAKDWTDVQCIEFMQVGLRNVQYASVRGAGPTVDEIRQGARVAMAKESGR